MDSITYTLTRKKADGSERDHELEIVYEYTPEDPGCHTMRNGDPGWPPSASEASVIVATLHEYDVTKFLTEKELEAIEEYIIGQVENGSIEIEDDLEPPEEPDYDDRFEP